MAHKGAAKCVTHVLTPFWHHLQSITVHTGGKLEFTWFTWLKSKMLLKVRSSIGLSSDKSWVGTNQNSCIIWLNYLTLDWQWVEWIPQQYVAVNKMEQKHELVLFLSVLQPEKLCSKLRLFTQLYAKKLIWSLVSSTIKCIKSWDHLIFKCGKYVWVSVVHGRHRQGGRHEGDRYESASMMSSDIESTSYMDSSDDQSRWVQNVISCFSVWS